MAGGLPKDHTTSNENTSFTKLPEYLNGYIDLITLVSIYKCLCESEKSDDITLAVWIKQNYLQEPLIENLRLIRDSEGFAKLDKAYRRVRQLTGKAQDKWPFFDQNWKKMSSNVVKNAILGDTVTKTPLSDNKGQVHNTPTSGVLEGQHVLYQ